MFALGRQRWLARRCLRSTIFSKSGVDASRHENKKKFGQKSFASYERLRRYCFESNKLFSGGFRYVVTTSKSLLSVRKSRTVTDRSQRSFSPRVGIKKKISDFSVRSKTVRPASWFVARCRLNDPFTVDAD